MSVAASKAPEPPPSSRRRRASSSRRWSEKLVIPLVVLVIAILMPFFTDNQAFIQQCAVAIAYVVMALGLNIVVGFAGLLDLGYVAFFAIGAYCVGWFASGYWAYANNEKGIHFLVGGFIAEREGIHFNFLLVLVIAVIFDRDRGHDHRPPDAAPARRLHRDRDARLRRDHRPPGRQPGLGEDRRDADHRRPPGHLAGRPHRPAVPRSIHRVELETLVLVRPAAGGDRAVRELPPAGLADGPRLGRAARGRDRRGGDGRPGGARPS